jgi:hypothetical protein
MLPWSFMVGRDRSRNFFDVWFMGFFGWKILLRDRVPHTEGMFRAFALSFHEAAPILYRHSAHPSLGGAVGKWLEGIHWAQKISTAANQSTEISRKIPPTLD